MKLYEFENITGDVDNSSLIGKIALCNIAQYAGKALKEQSIFNGKIIKIEKGRATIQNRKGNELIIPINTNELVYPPRGTYTFENGEAIMDPDFIIAWKVNLLSPIEESEWTANSAPHTHPIIKNGWKFKYAYDKEYLSQRMELDRNKSIGKIIIIGITYVEPSNENIIKRREQIDGIIIRANMREGIVIKRNDNNQEYKLPPDITMIQKAPRGEYRLKTNGKVIVDPGFITTWTSKEKSK